MYNGNIEATYTAVEENKQIEMQWRMKDWDVDSHVVITFNNGDDECEVIVEQKEIPTHDKYLKHVHLDNLENGWRANIFERFSKVFGYPIKK